MNSASESVLELPKSTTASEHLRLHHQVPRQKILRDFFSLFGGCCETKLSRLDAVLVENLVGNVLLEAQVADDIVQHSVEVNF